MNLNELITAANSIPQKTLCDPELPTELSRFVKSTDGLNTVFPATDQENPGEEAPTEEKAQLKLTARAEGGFRLLLLNNADDLSALEPAEQAIVNKWPAFNSLFDNNQALLVYDLKGTVAANAPQAHLGKVSLGFNTSEEVSLKSFRVHNCDEMLPLALAQDTASFTTLFQKEQVLKLKANEGVSFGSRLSVSFNSEISISDAFTGTASIVSKTLDLDGKLNLQADASLSVSAGFQIEDDFDIVMIRLAADESGNSKFKVLLNRKKQSSSQLALAANITAGIEKNDNFKKLVDQFFLGIDEKVFAPLLQDIEQLSDSHQALIDKAAQLLGQSDGFDAPAAFKAFYDKKRAELEQQVTEVLTSKISVGISYEYSKVTSEDTVYAALMSESFLRDHYKAIRSFKIDQLLSLDQPNEDYEITEFLKRDVKEVKKSFGISLSLGNFKLGSTKTRILKTVSEQKLIDHKVNYRVASYSESISKEFSHGKNTDKFYMIFDAHMDDYVLSEQAQTADKFDYGFGLSVESAENKTTDEELKNYVDWALTWDIINQSDFNSTIENIQTEVIDKADGPVRFFLSLGIGGKDRESASSKAHFKEIIKQLGQASPVQMTNTLGAAVPYAEYLGKALLLRATMEFRRLNYGNFWAFHFKNPSANKGKNYSKKVAKALAQSIEAVDSASAKFEKGPFGPGSFDFEPARMERILDLNPAVESDVDKLKESFGQLAADIAASKGYEESFEQFFKDIKKISYSKEFNLRFVGRLMLDLAEVTGIKEQVIRSLKLDYSIDGEDKVMVIG